MKTIKDIAEEAQVSTGTVDRVIHNRPGVSSKTKEKIQKLLDKYNFERNLLASALAFKRKYVIATLIPSSKSKSEYWYSPQKGLKSAFKEIQKYGVEAHYFYFNQFDLDSYKKNLALILKLNPDGIVFAPFFYNTSKEFAETLAKRNIKFVYININLETANNLSFIGQDSFSSGYLCGKMLNLCTENKGDLAILQSEKNINNHRAITSRVKGFLSYFSQKHPQKNIEKIYFENMDLAEVKKVLTNTLLKNNAIKGLFVPSSAAYTVAKFIESMKLAHIHIVGFDAHQNNAKYIKKGIIDFVVDQNPFDQGYLGVKILFEYLLLKKQPNETYNSPLVIVTKENVDHFMVTSTVEFST